MTRRRTTGALALVGLLATAAPAAANHETLLISKANGLNGLGGAAYSGEPSISTDGRVVAFESDADNLASFDKDGVRDVFVRDALAGTTSLVSRTGGRTLDGGDDKSSKPSISSGGRFVVFASQADNLNPIDNNGVSNVFMRDIQDGGTSLASVAPGNATGANGSSGSASISTDGRFIAFQSDADNLSSADNDNVSNVFVRDTLFGQTILVSRATGAAGVGADGGSFAPRISANGRFVAFESDANNLSSADKDGVRNVFVRDIQANTTTLVSRTTDPVLSPGAAQVGSSAANDHSGTPSISSGGRFVAFNSRADNLSGADDNGLANVFVRDLQGRTTTFAGPTRSPTTGTDVGPPSAISGDGRFVAFTSAGLSSGQSDTFSQVFVRDLQAATTELMSGVGDLGGGAGQSGAPGDGNSCCPSVSADGTFVAFASDAKNLSAADNDLVSDVFRRHHRVVKLASGPCANRLLGTRKRDRLTGTLKGDRISGRGGNDVLDGLAGDDCLSGSKGNDRLIGGPGRDRVSGGPGRDRIVVRGGGRDRVNCGGGRDRVRADRRDVVSRNCEVVKR